VAQLLLVALVVTLGALLTLLACIGVFLWRERAAIKKYRSTTGPRVRARLANRRRYAAIARLAQRLWRQEFFRRHYEEDNCILQKERELIEQAKEPLTAEEILSVMQNFEQISRVWRTEGDENEDQSWD